MSDMVETSCSQLPPEILQRVVSILPLVPLFRCRVVCKQWNAWITELHPQTPAQKTEIFIVPNRRRVPGEYWSVLDTSINKWYKIDCRFLSTEPHIGVGCIAVAAHKGLVLAGVNVGQDIETLFVCDPVSREHYEEIPELGLPPFAFEIVVADNTKSYKVYMLSILDEMMGGYDRVVNVYNSNDKRWTEVCRIPELSDNCAANIHFMAICEEFVHLLVNFEPEPEELKFHSILSYNMIENSWVEHGWSKIPLFLRKDIWIHRLLTIRGQLLLVGARVDIRNTRYRIRINILVWELSLGKNECVVIAQMPLSIFRTVQFGNIEVSGRGDRIFFLSQRSKMVTYCVLDDSWHCPPDLTAHDTLPEFVRCALFEKFMTLVVH